MGLGGISGVQLAIILLIVILIFGTKRIKQLGQDLGEGIKGMRSGMQEIEHLEDDINELSEDKDTSRYV